MAFGRNIRLAFVALSLLLASAPLSAAQPEPSLIERFKSEAPKAWQRFEDFAEGLQGTVTTTNFDLAKGRARLPFDNQVEFKHAGNFGWSLTRPYPVNENRVVNIQGLNSRYTFQLQGIQENGLKIKELTFLEVNDPATDLKLQNLRTRLRRWAQSQLYVDSLFLPTLLSRPAIKITNVSPDPARGHELALKVEYEFPKNPKVPAVSHVGSFRVDPAKDWIVLDYKVNLGTEAYTRLTTGSIEYTFNEKMPVVKRHVTTMQMEQKRAFPVHREKVEEFDLHVESNLPESAFTLSAFGLKERSKEEWDREQAVAELLEDDAMYYVTTLQNQDDASRAEASEETHFSGTRSLAVTPFQRFRSHIQYWGYPIAENPKTGEYRYLRFAWKRTAGPGIMLQLHVQPDVWHRYYAGTVSASTEKWGAMIRVAEEPPRQWELVTRDLYKDFGAMRITGIGFTPMEGGGHGYFDHIYLGRTIEDLDRITSERKNVAEGPGEAEFVGRRSRLWAVALIVVALMVVVLLVALLRQTKQKVAT